MNTINLYELGISAAERGDREQARSLLLQVVEDNPHHEEAWIWLCDLVDDPEDRIIALENVLTINPENKDARVLLETLQSAREESPGREEAVQARVFTAIPTEPLKRGTNALEETNSILAGANSPTTPVKDRRVLQARSRSRLMAVQRAISADDRDTALNMLVQMIQEDENNEEAWFILGHMAPTVEDQQIALENVLVLNPENKPAALRLETLKSLVDKNPFDASIWQENDALLRIVQSFLPLSNNTTKSSNNSDNHQPGEESDARQQNPTLRLMQVALWPALFYILLVMIQSFLLPLGFNPMLILGIFSVCIGSVLATAAGTTPRHPLWVEYFGEPGEKLEKFACWSFGGLGWLLAVSPFVLFFVFAVQALLPYLTLTR